MDFRIIQSIQINPSAGFPEIDIVITFFNHRKIVNKVLESVVDNSALILNLILIDDLSEDKTLSEIEKFVKRLVKNESREHCNVNRITVLQTKRKSIFEVMTSNLGLYFAITKFILFLQGDQLILENKFDLKLMKTLELNQDVFCVSGRGIHRFQDLENDFNKYKKDSNILRNYNKLNNFLVTIIKFISQYVVRREQFEPETTNEVNDLESKISEFLKSGQAGELNDSFFNLPINNHKYSSVLFKGQTVMRGPIVYRTNDLASLGGFDSESFYLGFDEHELNLKAFLKIGKTCAFLRIKTYAIYAEGATRKRKSFNQIYLANMYKSERSNNLEKTYLSSNFKNKDKIIYPQESVINPFVI